MGIYKVMDIVSDIHSNMAPPRRIVLLTLCAILAGIHLTSGFILRRPKGECPAVPPGVRCIPGSRNFCETSEECDWNKMCCSNGCVKICMIVSRGADPVPNKPPLFGPFQPPVKPDIPFPYDPYNPYNKYPPPNPLPDFRPDLPPYYFPPMDPENYRPDDDHLPVFPGGGYNDFP
ncbi:hypothetical protein GDO81_014984 [Engystomops pustulosus]|uniref:WAP domain-containing protein n=1 Tax=Engystomops pustulosus TaxID=76066 RepID=A0AAV7AK25_ENGPU|nr:hypothetical protein GDO81_014984 [Engystomops pustulosus]